MSQSSAKTLVLGVGNLLMSDEGVGVRVVERLVGEYDLPEEVQALDGGTLGLDLLYYLEGVENLLIVDAAETGQSPGSLMRLDGDEVPAFLSAHLSPHEIGVPDMLFAAKLKGVYPRNVVMWGVQPASLEMGLELSPDVQAQVDGLVSKLVEQLEQWEHRPRRRGS